MNKITYLAIPYVWDAEKSFEIANKIAADLMKQGRIVFSPISHSHKIADHLEELRFSQEFWMNQDLSLLEKCDEIIAVVINLKGINGYKLIKESKGCRAEIKKAKQLKLPISYLHYNE